MGDQYESVSIQDFDVVRSTQFVDDQTRAVCAPSIRGFVMY